MQHGPQCGGGGLLARVFSLFCLCRVVVGDEFDVFNNTVKDVVLGEDVGHASLLFVHGGSDVRSAKLAWCSYTLVGLSAFTPLFPGQGLCPTCGRLPPQQQKTVCSDCAPICGCFCCCGYLCS